MHPFSFEELMLPSIVIGLSILLVTQLSIKNLPLAILACLVKSCAFLIYFSIFFDGTYTFSDDWAYLEKGNILHYQGINIFNLHEKWDYIKMISSGTHVSYYLFNCFSIYLFGDYYFSPVALNIVMTGLIASLGKHILRSNLTLSNSQEKYFFFFLLFHPDIFAWSTIANLKDILILLLHLLLILSSSLLFSNKITQSALVAIPTIFILFFSRFYVPIFFALSMGLTLLGNRNFKGKVPLMLITLVMTFLIFKWIGADTIEYGTSAVEESYKNPIVGFFRMIMTPIPFHTGEAYSFLNIPALIHWLLIPALFRGFFCVFKIESLFFKFISTYFFCFVSFYSLYTELQGPRHKVQLDFAIAIFQFIGIMAFLNYRFKKTKVTSQ